MPAQQAGVRKSPQSQFVYRGLITQLGASVITLMLYGLALSLFGAQAGNPGHPGLIAAGLLGAVFLCMMIYSLGWRIGNRDQNLVKYGHIRHAPLRALCGYAVSQIPGFIVIVFALLEKNQWVSFPWAVPAAHFLYFPFVWFFELTGPHTLYLAYLLPFVALPPFCHWGYSNGYRFISLWQQIVYKRQKDETKNRAKDKRLR